MGGGKKREEGGVGVEGGEGGVVVVVVVVVEVVVVVVIHIKVRGVTISKFRSFFRRKHMRRNVDLSKCGRFCCLQVDLLWGF